ncbi:MAG: hypothetical protein WCL39_01345 [Armatimonadota bacterium]
MINSRFFVLAGAALVSIVMLALGTIYALNEASILPLGQQQQVQIVTPAEKAPTATPATVQPTPAQELPATNPTPQEAVN